MNINEKTEIIGLDKIGCTVGHLQACLHEKGMHEKYNYTYFGKKSSKGTVCLHTKNGDFTVKFHEKCGWLQKVEVL